MCFHKQWVVRQNFNYFKVQLFNGWCHSQSCYKISNVYPNLQTKHRMLLNKKTEDKTVCDKQNNVFKTKFITMLFTQSNLKISKSNHDLTCCLLKLFALRLGFMEVEQDFLQFILSVLEFCLKHRNLWMQYTYFKTLSLWLHYVPE